MIANFSRSYRFAAYTSAVITIVMTLVLGVFFYYFIGAHYGYLALFALICYCASFFIIQFRVERFIYARVKQIYEDIQLLDATAFNPDNVTTDMETLTKEMERFAVNKKMEIESLMIRDNYRKDFIGNISHELKTPLFTVQGYILTLLDGAMKDKAVRKKYLQRANKGVERLIYIVKDLDMITKLEVGDMNLNYEDFNIIELVQNVFDLLDMKANKKDITLTFDRTYDDSIFVNADREKIQQVLTNLIENSIKYGKMGGTTEVSIEDLVLDRIIVRVTDNGEGIEEDKIPRLFERFYRVDTSGSRKEGGSGLGLSIVKHIVEAHDEKIYVESEYGVGSEFSFTLEKSKQTP